MNQNAGCAVFFFLQLFTQNIIFNLQLQPRIKNFQAGVAGTVSKSVNPQIRIIN
jgi:hypothetical protein